MTVKTWQMRDRECATRHLRQEGRDLRSLVACSPRALLSRTCRRGQDHPARRCPHPSGSVPASSAPGPSPGGRARVSVYIPAPCLRVPRGSRHDKRSPGGRDQRATRARSQRSWRPWGTESDGGWKTRQLPRPFILMATNEPGGVRGTSRSRGPKDRFFLSLRRAIPRRKRKKRSWGAGTDSAPGHAALGRLDPATLQSMQDLVLPVPWTPRGEIHPDLVAATVRIPAWLSALARASMRCTAGARPWRCCGAAACGRQMSQPGAVVLLKRLS